jgi:hypothetical protein
LVGGEALEKMIDRPKPAWRRLPWNERKPVFVDFEIAAARNHVNLIRLHFHSVVHLVQRQRANAPQYFTQLTVVIRRQMQEQYERHACIWRQCAEELSEGLQTACGGTYAYNRKREYGLLAVAAERNQCRLFR